MQDVSFRERAIYLGSLETLVLSDIHIGRDESSSIEFPLGERTDLKERLQSLCLHFDPQTVVFAGDILHSFSEASITTSRILSDLVSIASEGDRTAILLEGNHDGLLETVWDGSIQRAVHFDDGTVVTHGDIIPELDRPGSRYIVGHDHPAISIEGVRRPCYLYGESQYQKQPLLMLPAFNRLSAGVEVNQLRTSEFQSPFITNAAALQPIVYDKESQETLRFPPLAAFRRLL